MKKIFFIVSTMLLTFGFVSCCNEKTTDTTTETISEETVTETDCVTDTVCDTIL